MTATSDPGVGDTVTVVGVLQRVRATRPPSWAACTIDVSKDDPETPERFRGWSLDVSGGLLGRLELGETVRLTGKLSTYRGDLQLRVDEQESLGIQGADEAHSWLMRLREVGPQRALGLYVHFAGDELLEVLNTPPAEGETDRLLEVEGIGQATAAAIRSSWAELAQRWNPEDLAYLGNLGLPRWQCNAVLDLATRKGVGVEELLTTDPYELIEVRGIAFRTADQIALAAGIARKAPARVEAGAVWVLEDLVDREGHTAIGRAELVARACEALNLEGREVGAAIGRLVGAGRLDATEDMGERLVHLPHLLDAERSVWELVTQPNPEPKGGPNGIRSRRDDRGGDGANGGPRAAGADRVSGKGSQGLPAPGGPRVPEVREGRERAHGDDVAPMRVVEETGVRVVSEDFLTGERKDLGLLYPDKDQGEHPRGLPTQLLIGPGVEPVIVREKDEEHARMHRAVAKACANDPHGGDPDSWT